MAQKEVRAHLPEVFNMLSQTQKQGIRESLLGGLGMAGREDGERDGWMMDG